MALPAHWLAVIIVAALVSACTSRGIGLGDIAPSAAVNSSSTTSTTPLATAGYPRFDDRDPHDWTDHAPWHYAVHGTDVSKYQAAIDWDRKKANGVSFAFIKATEGGDRVDDRFADNWRAAKAAGIPRGAYHFFYFCRPAFEQARWFIRHVPKEKSSLPPVLDMEWNPQSPSCKFRPKPDAVRKEMTVFLKQIERHYGRKPIVYTTLDFYRDNALHKIGGYPFWLRSTAGHPREHYGNQDWLFWQYTGTGIVPGVIGDADLNVFNGSREDWRRWLEQNAG